MAMSFGEVYGIATFSGLAGATKQDPTLWAYVAKHESSLRPDVVNSIGATGLWQINQPVHVKAHPTWTKEWLKDPWNNAKAAIVIYKDQGWSAWTAYSAAKAEYDKNGGNPPSGTTVSDQIKEAIPGLSEASESAQSLHAVADNIQKGASWISSPANWARVAYVLVGGLLILVAVNMTISGTLISKAGGLIDLVPGGGLAKKAAKAARSARPKEETP